MAENRLDEIAMKSRKAKARARELQQKRIDVVKKSDLPYSFDYKIRNAFHGKECPICHRLMGVGKIDECGIMCLNPVPSIQHNIPIAKGGKHTISNISVICRSCNSSIQDNITGNLNNAEVVRVWKGILEQDGIRKARSKTSKLGMERRSQHGRSMDRDIASS